MTQDTRPDLLVAGGGIAGLTAALALHAAGFGRVTVVEAASGIQPVGAGLNLMPNAVRELDALGLLGHLETDAVRTRELRYYPTPAAPSSPARSAGLRAATAGPSCRSTAATCSGS